MAIYQQVIDVCNGKDKDIFSTSEIINLVEKKYNRNAASIIPSDYCYNRINLGIDFKRHIFIYTDQEKFKFVGEKFPYTGQIFFKPKGGKERIVGEWNDGKFYLWEKFPKVSIEYYKPEKKPNSILSGDNIEKPLLPTKQDIEVIESLLRQSPDEEISLQNILDHIELTYNNSGKLLKENWRYITERNIEIWFSKKEKE